MSEINGNGNNQSRIVFTRDALRVIARRQERIDIDGGTVLVRELKLDESEIIGKAENRARANHMLFALAVVDEQHMPLYNVNSNADLEEIGNLPTNIVLKVVRVASKISGIRDEDIQAAIAANVKN